LGLSSEQPMQINALITVMSCVWAWSLRSRSLNNIPEDTAVCRLLVIASHIAKCNERPAVSCVEPVGSVTRYWLVLYVLMAGDCVQDFRCLWEAEQSPAVQRHDHHNPPVSPAASSWENENGEAREPEK
jgi:hypothetical protein